MTSILRGRLLAWFYIWLALPLATASYGQLPVTLEDLPAPSDPQVARCLERAKGLTAQAATACGPDRPYWDCAASVALKFEAIRGCAGLTASTAEGEAQWLYILTLLFRGVRGRDHQCVQEFPESFFWQEGSGVCVYNTSHSKRLEAEHPDSPFTDDAAFLRAEDSYVYYECEGSLFCAMENGATGWAEFVERFPRSPLIPQVLGRLGTALGPIERLTPERFCEDEWVHHTALDRLLRRFAEAATSLDRELSAKLEELLTRVRAKLDVVLAQKTC